MHRALGMTDGEYERVVAILGRAPNYLELAMYAVMWSEHCSYKSSRAHLGRLPSEGPQVLLGPGEGAGVIEAAPGIGVALRVESHNHPSAIEPYQGAATGVGGIIRDVLSVGARPIALGDGLCFGPLENARQRFLMSGVVSGISGYGNAVGVPTVMGDLVFDDCYSGNPLVNVACVGIVRVDEMVLGRASGAGNLAVLLGASTGRDGIGGVSVLASAGLGDGFSDESLAKRPSVQIGDPFAEKGLIEACLELTRRKLIVGMQDLGGAGLVCATSETAARAGMGMDVDVSAVRCREAGMEAFEIMTSESQERMLVISTPDRLQSVLSVCERHEVPATVVGVVTPPDDDGVGWLRIRSGFDGPVLGELPAKSLSEDAPCYYRPLSPAPGLGMSTAAGHGEPAAGHGEHSTTDPDSVPPPLSCEADLLALLRDPSWVYRQYDHQLFLNTVEPPGGDAALCKLASPEIPWPSSVTGDSSGEGPRSGEPRQMGMAFSMDANPGACSIDPRQGTAALVAESTLNVAVAGARPAALVNCLNFGNPEHPEVMWQLSEAIDGMAEACRALDVPVVGGNVSLYNENAGQDILPTPVVVVLGLVQRLSFPPPGVCLAEGGAVLLIGSLQASLGGSRWAVERAHARGGRLPKLDLAVHARLVELVSGLVGEEVAHGVGDVLGIHDVSAGGIGLCLAEMSLRSGIGLRVASITSHAELFSEPPSCVVACIAPEALERVVASCDAHGLETRVLGSAGGSRFIVEGLVDTTVDKLGRAWRGFLPDALALVAS